MSKTQTKPWSTTKVGSDWESGYWSGKDKKPAPVIENGRELTSDVIRGRLDRLREKLAGIDEIVGDIKDPEAQARRARELGEQWGRLERDLKDKLIEAGRWEASQLKKSGIQRFGMADDEGDRIITEMVSEQAEWFHDEVDKIKDRLAERLQGELDRINGEGHKTPVEVRDAIYDSLVEKEVIEAWEPLEF